MRQCNYKIDKGLQMNKQLAYLIVKGYGILYLAVMFQIYAESIVYSFVQTLTTKINSFCHIHTFTYPYIYCYVTTILPHYTHITFHIQTSSVFKKKET